MKLNLDYYKPENDFGLKKGEEKVIGVFSLKGLNGEVKVNLQDGEYINEIDNEKVVVKNGKIKINSKPIILFAR